MKFSTKQLHTGVDKNSYGTSTAPLYASTAYEFPSSKSAEARFALTEGGNIYSRITNPSQALFEERIAALYDTSAALAIASGSAATLYSIMNLAHAGDHIIAANNVYGGTFDLLKYTLPNLGIETTFVNPNNIQEYKDALRENTKCVIVETMSNPSSMITDIPAVADFAHSVGIYLIVDNTFCGPAVFNPLNYGADVVIESATKFYSGNGTVMGGLIIESDGAHWENSYLDMKDPSYNNINFCKTFGNAAFCTKARCGALRDTGACISPFNAWMLHLGTRTLDLRVHKQIENALTLVSKLISTPGVKAVHHPMLEQKHLFMSLFSGKAGSIFTIEVDSDKEGTAKFVDNLRLWKCEANVGDSISIINQPATTTHSQLTEEELEAVGIHGNTCRLSCGCEDPEDLYDDIVRALWLIQ